MSEVSSDHAVHRADHPGHHRSRPVDLGPSLTTRDPLAAFFEPLVGEAPSAPDRACAGASITTFFPPEELHWTKRLALEDRAKAICSRCPYQAACLEFAVVNDIAWGVWGGTGEKERRQIFQERLMRRF